MLVQHLLVPWETSVDASVDCNTPCAGDTTMTFGGAKFVDVYQAEFSEFVESAVESSSVSDIATVTSSTVAASFTVAAKLDSSASA